MLTHEPLVQTVQNTSALGSYKVIFYTIQSILKLLYPIEQKMVRDVIKDFKTFQPLLLKSMFYSNLFLELEPKEHRQLCIVFTS